MSDASSIEVTDEVIYRSIRELTNPVEEETVARWRRAAFENEMRYRELETLLHMATNAAGVVERPPAPAAADLTRLSAVAARRAGPAPVARRRHRRVWQVAAAAGVGALGFGLATLRPDRAPAPMFGVSEFVTGPSETATVALRDGTIVRLAPGSRLGLPPGGAEREVTLDGRAYFVVAKDPAHPFRVRTREGDAVVLGTSFDLRVDERELRLVVVDGRVAIDAGGRKVEVGPGQMSRVIDGTPLPGVDLPDVRAAISWLGTLLVFQSTSLRQVAVELERQYGVPVLIDHPSLGDLTITGWYADLSFDQVFRIVCSVVDARCSVLDGVARITR